MQGRTLVVLEVEPHRCSPCLGRFSLARADVGIKHRVHAPCKRAPGSLGPIEEEASYNSSLHEERRSSSAAACRIVIPVPFHVLWYLAGLQDQKSRHDARRDLSNGVCCRATLTKMGERWWEFLREIYAAESMMQLFLSDGVDVFSCLACPCLRSGEQESVGYTLAVGAFG